MSRAGPPPPGTPVPDAVVALAGREPVRHVWRNQLGGLTMAIGDPPTRFVKYQRIDAVTPHNDLVAEAERLEWAARHAQVPVVIDVIQTGTALVLVTEALPAHSAVDERFRGDPRCVVTAIGRGLRILHDTVPVDECPWSWSVETRLDVFEGISGSRPALDPPPAIDRLVVCHGDACSPNTLVDGEGGFVGHCDLASLGVADRWADLAVASMALEWNFGAGWEPAFFAAYGIDPVPDRISYYRDLWNRT